MYVEDLAKLFYKIFKNKSKKDDGYYNCGGGKSNSISILELIDLLEKLKNKKLNINFMPERQSDQKIFISNNNKLNKVFKWKPSTKKLEGIKLLFDWITRNKNNFKKFYK